MAKKNSTKAAEKSPRRLRVVADNDVQTPAGASVDTDTGEITAGVSVDDTPRQLKRLRDIRETEATVERLEDELDEAKFEVKRSRAQLKKTQSYLRNLIQSDPKDELPFEDA